MSTAPAGQRIVTTLWQLAWPIAVTGQLAVLAEAVVIFWIARLLGPEALAVEATLRPVMQCMGWMLLAVPTGVSVMVSQSVGAKDGTAFGVVETGLVLVLVVWAAIVVVVLPFSGALWDVLASSGVSAGDIRRYGLPLVLLMVPGLALVQVLLFAANGAGWTRLSLLRMVVDLCLGALFVPVFVLAFGLSGAPVGQAVSQFAMVPLIWRTLYRQRAKWHLGERDRSKLWDRPRWLHILDIGLPPQVARIAMFGSYAYLIQRVANDGRDAVAGYGIAFTFLMVAITCTGSVGRAVAIVIGQSIGAKDPSRAWRALRAGLGMSVGVGVVFAIVMGALAGYLPGILVDDARIQAHAGTALRILAWSSPFFGISQVFLFAFTAIKASKRAGMLGILADVAGVLFAMSWTGDSFLVGAAWSICVANGLRAVLFAALGGYLITRKLREIDQRSSSTNKE